MSRPADVPSQATQCVGRAVRSTLFSQMGRGHALTYGLANGSVVALAPNASEVVVSHVLWVHDGRSGYVLLQPDSTLMLSNAWRVRNQAMHLTTNIRHTSSRT